MKLATVSIAVLGICLSSCGGGGKACLPQGEKAVVLRTGSAEGYRYVTVRRSNGEEVTCTGKNTPSLLQEGDEIDGWTLTRADATRRD
jgi:hypothetical protein